MYSICCGDTGFTRFGFGAGAKSDVEVAFLARLDSRVGVLYCLLLRLHIAVRRQHVILLPAVVRVEIIFLITSIPSQKLQATTMCIPSISLWCCPVRLIGRN
jgi:hypothetical protein